MAIGIELLSILIKMKLISPQDALELESSFKSADITAFDEFLLSEGIVDDQSLLSALERYYQVPAFDVVGYFFEHQYVSMFPKELLLRYCFIPLEVEDNIMIVVAADPSDSNILFEIGRCVSYDIQFYVGIGRYIIDAVEEFYDKADTEDSFENEDQLEGEIFIELDSDDDIENSFLVKNEDVIE